MSFPVCLSTSDTVALLHADCPGRCKGRCRLAGAYKRCIQMCMICCKDCSCVPPGTYGNKWACPCYARMKNDKGTDKCP
ncbi:hypothetical protein KP509_37G026700 [Ceratopteris richardii]|uniref:Uncharacterized protein n=1 Tax=Ceratopteris richardii TaxID=49495 RepID=A0A8T2Q764_CERRI|nr:hypothetical protein KP509_37G026700 [Ceratopteris richardii]